MYGKIFKISKTPTQSGTRDLCWKIELEPKNTRYIENSTGWTSNSDMDEQLHLLFPSQELAISYAQKNNIEFTLCTERQKKILPKAYADNFIRKNLL
jgi:hypothetical protein